MPDPSSIGPAIFTSLSPEMSREQQREKLIAALERTGIMVKQDADVEDELTQLPTSSHLPKN
jgi:hypothetical protein